MSVKDLMMPLKCSNIHLKYRLKTIGKCPFNEKNGYNKSSEFQLFICL